MNAKTILQKLGFCDPDSYQDIASRSFGICVRFFNTIEFVILKNIEVSELKHLFEVEKNSYICSIQKKYEY